jgi:serine/threonine protein kinase
LPARCTMSTQASVAHRDLKPTNVMIAEGEDPLRVVLIDFGPAVLAMETDELTGAGTFVGTPVYVSPEILQGQTATPASDIFALGVMLFEALTGVRPWSFEHFATLASAKLTQPPALGELASSVSSRRSRLRRSHRRAAANCRSGRAPGVRSR